MPTICPICSYNAGNKLNEHLASRHEVTAEEVGNSNELLRLVDAFEFDKDEADAKREKLQALGYLDLDKSDEAEDTDPTELQKKVLADISKKKDDEGYAEDVEEDYMRKAADDIDSAISAGSEEPEDEDAEGAGLQNALVDAGIALSAHDSEEYTETLGTFAGGYEVQSDFTYKKGHMGSFGTRYTGESFVSDLINPATAYDLNNPIQYRETCPYCGLELYSQGEYASHVKQEEDKQPHASVSEPKTNTYPEFKAGDTLHDRDAGQTYDDAMKEIRTKVAEYENSVEGYCPVCTLTYATITDAREHVKTMHNGEVIDVIPSQESGRKFLSTEASKGLSVACPFCDKHLDYDDFYQHYTNKHPYILGKYEEPKNAQDIIQGAVDVQKDVPAIDLKQSTENDFNADNGEKDLKDKDDANKDDLHKNVTECEICNGTKHTTVEHMIALEDEDDERDTSPRFPHGKSDEHPPNFGENLKKKNVESITLEKIADECGCERGKSEFYTPIFEALGSEASFVEQKWNNISAPRRANYVISCGYEESEGQKYAQKSWKELPDPLKNMLSDALYDTESFSKEIRGEFTCPECDIEFNVTSPKGEQNFIDHLVEDHDYTRSEAQDIYKYRAKELGPLDLSTSKPDDVFWDTKGGGMYNRDDILYGWNKNKMRNDLPHLEKQQGYKDGAEPYQYGQETDEKIWEDYPPTEKGGRQAGEAITCDICKDLGMTPNTFSNMKEYSQHIKDHKEADKSNECEICGNESHTTLSHIEKIDSMEVEEKCPTCNGTGKEPTDRTGHGSSRSTQNFQECPDCEGTGIKSPHMKYESVDEKECEYGCGFKTSSQAELDDHERGHRGAGNEAKPYSCYFCGRGFDDNYDLDNHVKNKHPEEHKENLAALKRAKQMANSKENTTRYNCKNCSYTSDDSGAVAEHEAKTGHIMKSEGEEADYATIKHGSQKVEPGSAQDRLLHARDLPHSHVHTEDGKKEIKRYGKGTGENMIEDEGERVKEESPKVKENIDNLKCDLCTRQFKNEDDYKDHMRDAHDEASEYSSLENILAMAKSA